MENRRFTIKPEVEKEILDLVNGDGWLEDWLNWIDAVKKSDLEYEQLFENARPFLRFETNESSGNIESLFPLINHIWRNRAYGSIAHSEISEQSLREQFELLASITREIDACLQNGLPPGEILNKTSAIEDGRGDLKALRLRAIAVMSRLEFPSFFAANHFNSLASLLGLEVSFPYQVTELMYQLSDYLPENLRGNKYVRFTFPWIIYEELNKRKNNSAEVFNNPTAESNEPVLPPQNHSNNSPEPPAEKQYWWLNISQEEMQKLAPFPIDKLASGHQLNFPFEMAVGLRVLAGDKIYWPNSDGGVPQLTFTVGMVRERDYHVIVDQVFDFPMDIKRLEKEPEVLIPVLSSPANRPAGFIPLAEKEYYAIIRFIEKEIERRKRIEKSTVASRLHSDGETVEDKLNYRLYATAIGQIIKDERTKPPVNIAIIAPWGHGKTTLMEFLREEFENRQDWQPKKSGGVKMTVKELLNNLQSMFSKGQQVQQILETPRLQYPTVWFNPWKYQSSEQIWAGIGHALITQLIGKNDPVEQEKIWLRLRLRRIDRNEVRRDFHKRLLNSWLPWLAGSLITIITSLIFLFIDQSNEVAQTTVAGGFIAGITSGLLKYKKEKNAELDGKLADYIREPDYAAKLGVFHEINEDLKIVASELIDPAKPAIVFIDDLDRCTPKTVAEVFEAVNLMMTGELKDRCYFVIGMDAQMVAAALDTEYNSWAGRLPDQERRHGSVGWYFLDKFIQLPFFIPVMDPKKREKFIGDLFAERIPVKLQNASAADPALNVEAAVEQVVSNKGEVVPQMIEQMKISNPVQYQEVKEKVVAKAIEQSKDSDEINTTIANFAEYLDTSPRGMKRFANLLRFYDSQRIVRRMDRNLQQGELPEFDVLARWLVINLRWPQMVRWIQWEREEVLLFTVDPEQKADHIDCMLDAVKETEFDKAFDEWTKQLETKKLAEKKHLLWLYDRDLFKVLWKDRLPHARLKRALECDVW